MVLYRILPCVTGVKRGRVDLGARERQEGEVRNAVYAPPPPSPPPFSLARTLARDFPFLSLWNA